MRVGSHLKLPLVEALEQARVMGWSAVQTWPGPDGYDFGVYDSGKVREAQKLLQYCDLKIYFHVNYRLSLCKSGWKRISAMDHLRKVMDISGPLNATAVTHMGRAEPASDSEDSAKLVNEFVLEAEEKAGYWSLLLENSAAGSPQISKARELQWCLKGTKKTAVCWDTAHAYAAGYDIEREEVLDELKTNLGDRIEMVHFNNVTDKVRLGFHLDRHDCLVSGKLNMNPTLRFVEALKLESLIVELKEPDESINFLRENLRQVA